MARKQIEWAVNTFLEVAKNPDNIKYIANVHKKNDTIVHALKQEGKTIGVTWLLHGNRIATIDLAHNLIHLSLAGYPSKSTMERLNELCVAIGLNPYAFTGYTASFRWSVAKPCFMGERIECDEIITLPLKDFKANVESNTNLDEFIRRKQDGNY